MDYSKSCYKRIMLEAALFFIMLIMLSFPSLYVYADNPASSVTPFYTLVNGEKVYVLDIKNLGYYLFLPAEADANSISFYSNNYEQVLIKNDDALSEELDISNSIPNENNVYEADLLIVPDPDDTSLSETVHLNIMKGKDIGTVYYNSDDIENRGMRWVDANRNNHGTGSVIVIDQNGNTIYDGQTEDIHIRGSSAIIAPKKSYQIKLSKKTALVGTEKGKKWVLLAMYYDPLRINDKIMKDIANISDDKYSAKEAFVNLYYDGAYRGVYNLSEKNEIKSNRIDITNMEEYYESQYPEYGDTANLATSKNKYNNTIQYDESLEGPEVLGGYLIEMNSYIMDSPNGFFFTANDLERAVTISSPELGSKEVVTYISEFFQDFSNAIYSSEEKAGWNPDTGLFYYDYCNLDSLVNSYLLQTISSNGDGFWKSQFFYKDANEMMRSGPIWDMDNTFGMLADRQADPYEDILTTQAISGGLINIPSFRSKLKERYFSHYQSIMASLLGEDDKVSSFMDLYESVKPDLLMDAVLWPVKYKTHDGLMQWAENESLDVIAEYRVDWIRKHKEYLDLYFGSMDEPEETSHIYEKAVYENEEYHKRVCTKCGDVLSYEHVWDGGNVQKEANCVEKGSLLYTCTICDGTRIVPIPVTSSHSLVCVEEKPSTYESDGNIEYYICSNCGKLFKDSAASVEINENDIIISKKDHPVVYRIYGQDRYETSLKVASDFKERLGQEKFNSVIVACGTNYADALSGSYLSSVKKAPILLVDKRKDHIGLVQDFIRANLETGGTIYLLGGAAVVPESVTAGLGGFNVKRLWGQDRYETNIAILEEAGGVEDMIMICSGTNFADCMSAAALGKPILLVKSAVSNSQLAYIKSLNNKSFQIAGGTGAVNEKIEATLMNYGMVTRIGGADRYETSANLANAFFGNSEGAIIAYGRDFPDGLCGGGLANIMGVPLLLAAEGKIDAAQSFMADKNVNKAAVLGGPSLISDINTLKLFGLEDEGVITIK